MVHVSAILKKYEFKLRTALSNMGCMQIIKRGEGACNITGELNRIYKFQCILENAQLCSQYFTLLYPNDPQKM